MNCKTCKHWKEHEIIAVAIDYDGPALKEYGDCYKITNGTAVAYLRSGAIDKESIGVFSTEETFYCSLYEKVE